MTRAGEALWWLLAKVLNTAVVLANNLRRWWSQSSEGKKKNEQALTWTLAAQPNNGCPWPTLPLPTGTASHEDSRSHFFYYSERRIPGAIFFNVNIFNFSHEACCPNVVFAPIIAILLTFLQVRISAANASPFQFHPIIFVVAVLCSIAYYFNLGAKFVFPGFASLFEALTSAFGYLAVASLMPLVLQLPWWSIFFILLFLGGFFKLLNKLHGIYSNMHRPYPRTVQQLPI